MLLALWGGDGLERKKIRADLLKDFWSCFLLAGLFASFLSRLKYGGWDNVLYSLVAVISLFSGILLGRFLALPEPRWSRRLVSTFLILQFLFLVYNPFTLIPREADYRGGEILLQRLSEIPGPILVFYHSHLGYMAKKGMSAHAAALKELPNVYDAGVPFKGMPKDLYEAITRDRYAAIILDDRAETELGNPWTKFISKYYSFSEEVYKPGEPRLRFMTGAPSVPRFIYRPRVAVVEEE